MEMTGFRHHWLVGCAVTQARANCHSAESGWSMGTVAMGPSPRNRLLFFPSSVIIKRGFSVFRSPVVLSVY